MSSASGGSTRGVLFATLPPASEKRASRDAKMRL